MRIFSYSHGPPKDIIFWYLDTGWISFSENWSSNQGYVPSLHSEKQRAHRSLSLSVCFCSLLLFGFHYCHLLPLYFILAIILFQKTCCLVFFNYYTSRQSSPYFPWQIVLNKILNTVIFFFPTRLMKFALFYSNWTVPFPFFFFFFFFFDK